MLVGSAYIQASTDDPGAVGPPYSWMQSDTGDIYYRNDANTDWVIAGNTDSPTMGQVARTGDTMTGPITGAHGIMPLTGGDFTNPPTINGDTVATQYFVLTQIATSASAISVQIAQAVASIPGLDVQSKVAIASGLSDDITSGHTFTIPLPTYGDGTIATADQASAKYGVWVEEFPESLLGDLTFSLSETSSGSMVYNFTAGSTGNFKLGYYVIAIKS